MGDQRRGQLFAQFLVKHFPKAHTFLIVADGRGDVSRKLANKKRAVIVVERSPRWEGNIHKRVRYISDTFSGDYAKLDIDVVAGMHPDEATGEIIRYAVKYRLPFAICPCCIKGHDAEGVRGYLAWIEKLKSLPGQDYNVRLARLKMAGKNDVIWGTCKTMRVVI